MVDMFIGYQVEYIWWFDGAYRKRSYSSICDEVDMLFFFDVFLAKKLLAKNGNRGYQ